MKTEQIRQHFQVQVPNYSGLMQRLIPFYDTQRDVMLGLMPLDRDAPLRVLDLGCGPGLIAARVLAEFARAELTLIDLTPEMVDECRSRLSGFDRVDYRVADFRTDDFGEGYDVVLASLSLHHLELSERSFGHLESYARSQDYQHWPAWVAFNRRMGHCRGDVGIWHETYRVRAGEYETVYSGMPRYGLGKAGNLVPASGRRASARGRFAPGAESPEPGGVRLGEQAPM